VTVEPVTNPLAISDRQQLAAFLDGKSDARILEEAHAVGPDKVLARVFQVMEAEYDTSMAPGEDVTVLWEIAEPGGNTHQWHIIARPDGCSCAPGAGPRPDVTLRLGVITFLGIMSGRVGGMKALSTGKLKLKGDLFLAMSIEKWFAAG
jgi:hypothetical protein